MSDDNGSETSETAGAVNPASLEDQARRVMLTVAAELGVSLAWDDLPVTRAERVAAIEAKRARVAQADGEAAAAMGKVRTAGRKALKRLRSYDREKPTPERAAAGVFDLVDAARFDSSRDKERLLIDWKSRAGGAGEMYARGQIGWRELLAASMLMRSYELSQASQLSGRWKTEFTQGGGGDPVASLRSAAEAWRAYRWALARLSRKGRFLVEQRVVMCKSMEDVVRGWPQAFGAGDGMAGRRATDRAGAVLVDALEQMADAFRLPGAGQRS